MRMMAVPLVIPKFVDCDVESAMKNIALVKMYVAVNLKPVLLLFISHPYSGAFMGAMSGALAGFRYPDF